MPVIELFTLCDFAQISQDNKLSLIGIFDRIYTSALPTIYSRFFIVAVVGAQSMEDHTVEISLTSPNGKLVIPSFQMKTKIGASGKANILADLAGIKFDESGEYTVEMIIDGNVSQSIPLYVTKVQANSEINN